MKSKLFSHGFTTREDGHGSGLHSNGRLILEGEGPGKGTVATLSLPLR